LVRRDPYQVLGVCREVDADGLKKAYRKLAREHHPDQNPDDPEASKRFREVVEAYALLSDPDERSRYDRHGRPGTFDEPGAADLAGAVKNVVGGFIEDIFGLRPEKKPGRDLSYTLDLSFEQAALGCERIICFDSPVICPSCDGWGGRPEASGGLVECHECRGSGRTSAGPSVLGVTRTCRRCEGRGKIVRRPCTTCRGSGVVTKERQFSVRVPPGTTDGTLRVVQGEGAPGQNGGPNGDLQVLLRVNPHPVLDREGRDVVCEVVIDAASAALGTKVEVPSLEGTIELEIPAGTQPGRVFHLPERGIARAGRRGEQRVTVTVETPSKLTAEQRSLLSEVRDSLSDSQTPLRREYLDRLEEIEA
jgi:molecular chaperone DnaJ